ncbi:KpsF/GutQ family protein [Aureimonas ureilytica]|uniref:KpsF/GutQ family protein n=1 Tax=Aureimonas ureilytica TaxID=401562 RepID=A0A175RQX2_9HYPH|nr:KpsF/GutQ family sugar-phosphate isomerase [Aureimonas ureilytica]KTR05813.1 KpsF/GutQ family protein [Aureimonas ureilytica]
MALFMLDLSASPGIASALRTVGTEAEGLHALAAALQGPLGPAFEDALARIAAVSGRVIVTGIGKSGHIGAKIAATFASTGTPASFVHAAEANHGDLGMIASGDVVLALSKGGESPEMKSVIAYTRRFSIPLIAMTAAPESSLGREADVVLLLPPAEEACPHGLAPTTSALTQLALGDALAIALLEARGFSPSDFRVFHPGGKLGAILTHVGDIMHRGEAMPLIASGALMSEAILAISHKGFGCVAVVDVEGRLLGIITDGDLRRHLAPDLLLRTVDEVMTRSPKTIRPDTLAVKALDILNSSNITALMVVEADLPVGILHLHDLLRIGVV